MRSSAQTPMPSSHSSTSSSQPSAERPQAPQAPPARAPAEEPRRTAPAAAPASASSGAPPTFWQRVSPTVWLVANLLMLLNAIGYAIPVLSFVLPFEGLSSAECYYRALKLAAFIYALCISTSRVRKLACCSLS